MYKMGTFSILRYVDAAAAGPSLVIEAWGAGACAGESCGPARRPQSRGAAVCGADEAALCWAAPSSFTAADFLRNRWRCWDQGPRRY